MPFVNVVVDHVAIFQCYQIVIEWLSDDKTNKSEVSRITGISRNTLNRLMRKDKRHEPMISNFIRIVKAYEVMELGYSNPQDDPDDLEGLEHYNSQWKPDGETAS